MSIAFNKVSFNIGLLAEAKKASPADLMSYHADKINMLADALKTERFYYNYPKADLQECIDLYEESNFTRVKMTDTELWGKVWDGYLIPTGRNLAKFTLECASNPDMLACLKGRERTAWLKLSEVLRDWTKTPFLPNVYQELAVA